jgi:cell division protein FtsB
MPQPQPFLTAKAIFLYKKMKKQEKNIEDIKKIVITALILLLMAVLGYNALFVTPSKVKPSTVVYSAIPTIN